VAIEARGNSLTRARIAAARTALLAEHLDVTEEEVREALAASGSLAATVARLAKDSGRTLRRFERLNEPSVALATLASGIVDPERPVFAEELISGLPLRERVWQA
jgi:phospholipase D1/2